MKKKFGLVFIFSLIPSLVRADWDSPIKCINAAQSAEIYQPYWRKFEHGIDMATWVSQLCSGAKSIAPAQCALRAHTTKVMNSSQGTLSRIAQLCAGATSDAPVRCAEEALKLKLMENKYNPIEALLNIARLCSGATENQMINAKNDSKKNQ